MARKLPEFEGYTVDARLKEFRKAEYGKTMEFLPFDSMEGRKLLERMRRARKVATLTVFKDGGMEFECTKCGIVGSALLCSHFNDFECEQIYEE